MPGKFVITKDKRGEFRFKLVATNGQTVAVSEGYNTRAACMSGIESVRKSAPDAKIDDSALTAATMP